MTYCLGIKLRTGLVALADTRISTAGGEVYSNKKLSVHHIGGCPMFIMTAGLRSVRDKSVTYFKSFIEDEGHTFKHMYEGATAFGNMLRKVAHEDKAALRAEGYSFNLTAIVGGQMPNDDEHKMFLIFPEGNWIEINEGLMFQVIGNSNYGKPLLNRSLHYDTSMEEALKIGYLSFDSTRVSANDVDFPLDIVLYDKGSYTMVEHRVEQKDVSNVSQQWAALLRNAVKQLPEDWMTPIFEKKTIANESN
jgi:putative proteasome-type protease